MDGSMNGSQCDGQVRCRDGYRAGRLALALSGTDMDVSRKDMDLSPADIPLPAESLKMERRQETSGRDL